MLSPNLSYGISRVSFAAPFHSSGTGLYLNPLGSLSADDVTGLGQRILQPLLPSIKENYKSAARYESTFSLDGSRYVEQ